LIVISAIDYQFHFIPNKILLFLLIAGIAANLIFQTIAWTDAITGLFFSPSIMLIIRILGNCILLRESMGKGDIKFAAVLGFYIGWQNFIGALFLGSLLALLITSLSLNSKFNKIQSKIPLAPYLSIATLLCILMSDFF
jgi:leader peptidase (prepilin peptidase)/N-methyltransferase